MPEKSFKQVNFFDSSVGRAVNLFNYTLRDLCIRAVVVERTMFRLPTKLVFW